MNIYSKAYQLAEEQQLSPLQTKTLLHSLLMPLVPSSPSLSLWRLTSILAAALCGFGLIMWIAANWNLLDRSTHFFLLQAVLVLTLLIALTFKSLRIPLSLLALLEIGALFAYYGQTYQTGADPWQLFAVWAALGLPLCLGTRSDALWIPWTAIILTAFSLWLYTHTGYSVFALTSEDFPVHSSWLFFSTLLLGLLAPQWGRWTGASAWSQRAAMLLVCYLLLTLAFAATNSYQITDFSSSRSSLSFWPRYHLAPIAPQYYLVMLWLVLAFAIFSCRLLYDAVNASVVLLSFDIAILMGLYHFLWQDLQEYLAKEYLFLIGGVLATLLFAASALALIKIARFHAKKQQGLPQEEAAPDTKTEADPQAQQSLPATETDEQSWPFILFTGLGAWLASILLVIGIFGVCTLFFRFSEITEFFLVIGLVCIAISTIALCQKSLPLFFSQACLPILFVGLSLFAYAVVDRSSSLTAAMLSILALCLVIAFFIHTHWHRALLGFVAACSGAGLIINQLDALGLITGNTLWLLNLNYGLLLIWALILLAQRLCINWTWGRYPAQYLECCGSGWLLLTLIALCVYSGTTFLLGGILHLPPQAEFGQAESWQRIFGRGLPAMGATLVACAWLAWCWPKLRQKKNLAIVAIFCLLAFFMPALGPALLALNISLTSGRRVLALAASITIAWIIGSFYYQLHWSLLHKAQVLIGLGLILGLLIILFASKAWTSARQPMCIRSLLPDWRTALTLGICLLTTLGITQSGIHEKEMIIANGRPIFVSLRPVDPRSLMQGDYMALNFPLPSLRMDSTRPGAPPVVLLTVDKRGLATLSRDEPEISLGPDQYRVQLRHTDRGWAFVTNAWYFQEGEGKRWAKAEFGEFRLLPGKGTLSKALLVGMRDQDFKPIQ